MKFNQAQLISIGFRRKTWVWIWHLALVLLATGLWLSIARAEILIPDVPEAVRSNLVAQLSITDQTCSALVDTPLIRSRTLKEADQALQAIGYYQSGIALSFSRSTDENPCWQLLVQITLPPPVRISQVDVRVIGEAQYLPTFTELLHNLPVQVGAVANHRDYENLKRDLLAAALQYGYFDADFTQAELRVDLDQRQAQVILLLEPGQRYQFGVLAMQPTVLNEDFLRRYTSFQMGDAYEQQKLEMLHQDYFNAGYFQRVSIQPQRANVDANQQIPIRVEFVPKPQHAYELGGGAATDTGPRVTLGYQNRYLNQQGMQFNQKMTLSEVKSDIQSKLTLPLSQPARQQWEIYGGFQAENTDTTKEDTLTVGTAYLTRGDSGWQRSIFFDVLREGYQIGQQADQVLLLMPGISWTKTQTDDWVYPRDGWRLQTRLRAADRSLGSDTDFAQAWASAKSIRGVGPMRLLLRGELGLTEYANFDALPSSIRFFAGGDSSVRGYDYKSLGPLDSNGDVSGGPQLLVTSAELDYRWRERWAVAAFFDQGNAFYLDSNPSFGDLNLARGVGVGLRWLSPLGPIRFDLAKALDVNQGVRFHLSMGPDL